MKSTKFEDGTPDVFYKIRFMCQESFKEFPTYRFHVLSLGLIFGVCIFFFYIYSRDQMFKTTFLSATFLGVAKWNPSALHDLLSWS